MRGRIRTSRPMSQAELDSIPRNTWVDLPTLLRERNHSPDAKDAANAIEQLQDELDRYFGIGGELIVSRRERDRLDGENKTLRDIIRYVLRIAEDEGWYTEGTKSVGTIAVTKMREALGKLPE